MDQGTHNNYCWFQTFDTSFTIDTFLKAFKQHLVDKFVCISSFDSGELLLSDDEKQLGWQYIDKIATSPQLNFNSYIPTAGFDEWYIFAKRPSAIKLTEVYVNYGNFSLTVDSDLLKLFWLDIEFNQPIIYIAEGDSLKIVTSDQKLKQDIKTYWC